MLSEPPFKVAEQLGLQKKKPKLTPKNQAPQTPFQLFPHLWFNSFFCCSPSICVDAASKLRSMWAVLVSELGWEWPRAWLSLIEVGVWLVDLLAQVRFCFGP